MSEALAELARAVSDTRAELVTLTAAVERLRSEVVRSREEMASLRMALSAPQQQLLPFAPQQRPAEQLVTLDQMAAICGRNKRSLERHKKGADALPPPRVEGRRGRASLWAWADVRPWLLESFGRPLPEVFPELPPAG